MAVQGMNVTLGEESPTFVYTPQRDGPAAEGWNASYTGSAVYNPGGYGAGVAYRLTTYSGASVALSFEGTGLYLCFRTSSSYTFTVDGKSIITTADPSDDACADYDDSSATLAVADGLEYGPHEAVLRAVLLQGDFWFYGGVVTLSIGVSGTTPQPSIIDDGAPGWQLVPDSLETAGGWWRDNATDTANPQDENYDGGHTWCCTYSQDSTATYPVTGASALQLVGIVTSNTYGYTVAFNGASYAYNSSNLWRSTKQVLFFIGGLNPNTTYPLTIIDWDASEPQIPAFYSSSTQFCVNIDAILVQKGTATLPEPSTSSAGTSPSTPTSSVPTISPSNPSSSGSNSSSSTSSTSSEDPIIGGAVGGGIALLLACLILFLYLRWRRKKRNVSVGNPGFLDEPMVEPVPYHDVVRALSDSTSPSVSVASPYSANSTTDKRPSSYFPPVRNASGGVPGLSNQPRMEGDRPAAQASTVELVQILNARLREEQADNIVAPPLYDQ